MAAARSTEYVVIRQPGTFKQYVVLKSNELVTAPNRLGMSLRQFVKRIFGSRSGRGKVGRVPSHARGAAARTGGFPDGWVGRIVDVDSAGIVKAVGIPEQSSSTGSFKKRGFVATYARGEKTYAKASHARGNASMQGAAGGERSTPAGKPSPHPRRFAAVAAGEATDIRRHPSVQPRSAAIPGHLLTVEVDLLRRATDLLTESGGVRVSGLPDDWKWIDIDVTLFSPFVQLDDPDERRRIRVRRNQDSTPCIFSGMVAAGAEGRHHIDLFVSFWYRGRSCGSARRQVPVRAAADPEMPPPPQAAAPRKVAAQGTFRACPAAEPPVLTVKIRPMGQGDSGQLFWDVATSLRDVDGLPDTLSGVTNLGTSPAAFVDRLLDQTFGRERGRHVLAMTSFGQMLFDATPPEFRAAYWALRTACRKRRQELTIQFICFEPRIPWEMMYPHRGPKGERSGFLFAEHRVARWLGAYEGRLRDRYPQGPIVSVVPRYAGEDRLEAAEEEGARLRARFGAVAVPGTWKAVTRLLTEKAAQPIGILHFAGHGAYDPERPEASVIHLEGEDHLTSLDFRSSGLGAAKDHPLVLFNACEVGNVGHLLNHVAGWADSFLYGDFGGVVAPIWTVYDTDAAETMLDLVGQIRKARPVSEALRRIRRKSGQQSQTFLAYIYYGDVTARMASLEA